MFGRSVDIAKVTESGMTDHDVAFLPFAPCSTAGKPSGHRRADPGLRPEAPGGRQFGKYRINRESSNCWARGRGIPLGDTGNIEPGSQIRWAGWTSTRFFAFGGYGSDSPNQAELTLHAIQARRGDLRQLHPAAGPRSSPGRFHRGRRHPATSAAHEAGIRMVSVATGLVDLETHEAAGPRWALPTVEEGFPSAGSN